MTAHAAVTPPTVRALRSQARKLYAEAWKLNSAATDLEVLSYADHDAGNRWGQILKLREEAQKLTLAGATIYADLQSR